MSTTIRTQLNDPPLEVDIYPRYALEGRPGETVELQVTVLNRGRPRQTTGATIEIFLSPADCEQNLGEWCQKRNHKFGLAVGRSDQVTFHFDIPADALTGTYSFNLEVDALDDYPEDTPIQSPLKLRVLDEQYTVVNVNDPTFTIEPPTSPGNPVALKPGNPLTCHVQVNNRSLQVDRFHLSADLDQDWLTIRYGQTNLGVLGIYASTNMLELNPGDTGLIEVEIHPPTEVLAGVYHPTFRLRSSNRPDLVLLDLIYLRVEDVHLLAVNLLVEQDRVEKGPGEYALHLHNQGNTVRQLMFRAKTREERELCRYKFTPPEIRLAPDRESEAFLQVYLIHQWRRSFAFWSHGRSIRFQVELLDTEDQKLSRQEQLHDNQLVWKPRPWWHFLLLILAILGSIAGIWFLLWWYIFRPSPIPEVVKFAPHQESYTEGEEILLNFELYWKRRNVEQLRRIEITADPQPIEGADGKPSNLSPILITVQPDQTVTPEDCKVSSNDGKHNDTLICTSLRTGAYAAGEYTFQVDVEVNNQGDRVDSETPVRMEAKELPEIVEFVVEPTEFIEGKTTWATWTLSSLESLDQLVKLDITAESADGLSSILVKSYSFDSEAPTNELSECQQEFRTWSCTAIPLPNTLNAGLYDLQMSGIARDGQDVEKDIGATEVSTAKIKVNSPPITIQTFDAVIKGQKIQIHPPPATPNPPLCVKAGEAIELSWSVTGKEVSVNIADSIRNRNPEGNATIFAPTPDIVSTDYPIQLTATNKEGFSAESDVLRLNVMRTGCEAAAGDDPLELLRSLDPASPQYESLQAFAQQMIVQFDLDSRDIRRRIRQHLGSDPLPGPSPGKLLYPIDAPVTSEYGYRTHPISGVQRLHAGMDFGAPSGTPIKAAERGKVIHSGWYQGYGNTVILDHGEGLSTLYAHASELIVSTGDPIRAGETVSLVGSTGYSTGPHLHFEVLENDEAVNPRNYLD